MLNKQLYAAFAVIVTIGFNGASASAQTQVQFASNGTLSITGDSERDQVWLIENDGEISVFTADSVFLFDAAPVERIEFELGGNADSIQLDFEFLMADLEIDTGSGIDRVVFGSTDWHLIGTLNINTGLGWDTVICQGITIYGDTVINTGNGRDTIDFGNQLVDPDSTGSRFLGDLVLNTGVDSDNVYLAFYPEYDVYVGGVLDVELGQSNDSLIGHVTVDQVAFLSGGQGDDNCRFLSITAPEVTKIGFED